MVILAHASYQMPKGVPGAVGHILGHWYVGTDFLLVASGLSLSWRWPPASLHRAEDLRRYAIRRVCRIVPLFYLAIGLYLVLFGRAPRPFAPLGLDWLDIGLTAGFLLNWRWTSLNSVVPGDWAVGAVATFYLIFPLLARWASSRRAFWTLTIGWMAATQALNLYTQAHHHNEAFAWSFPGSGVVFLFGMAAARYTGGFGKERRAPRVAILGNTAAVCLTGFLIAGLPLWHLPEIFLTYRIQASVLGALLCLVLHRYSPAVVVNPLIALIGRMAFSIMVLHTLVLWHAEAFAEWLVALIPGRHPESLLPLILLSTVVCGSVVVGFLGFALVEQPGIRLGRRLTQGSQTMAARATS